MRFRTSPLREAMDRWFRERDRFGSYGSAQEEHRSEKHGRREVPLHSPRK